MTHEQLRALIETELRLNAGRIERWSATQIELMGPTLARLAHVQVMLQTMQGWDLQADWDKAQRWWGFIQGAYWVSGVYTIDEMREQNR